MTKQYTCVKVGYTAGIYGCSGEYFTLIYVNSKGMHSISFHGMYGSEDRVQNILKDKGYKPYWTPSDYGRMKYRDINKNMFVSEQQATEELRKVR